MSHIETHDFFPHAAMFGCAFFIIFSQLFIGSSGFFNISETLNLFPNVSQFAAINVECAFQFNLLRIGLENGEEWAMRMIDATAKPQAGLFFGNIMHVGNYDECLEVGKIYGDGKVRGKYCTALFQPHEEYGQGIAPLLDFGAGKYKIEEGHFTTEAKKSYGFCVPEYCEVEDLQLIADALVEQYKCPLKFKFFDEYCDVGDGQPFSTAAVVAICIFTIFAVIIGASTVYDVCYYQKLPEKIPNIYTAFSVVTNGKKLITINTGDDLLGCLNGFRVISMWWVLIFHRYLNLLFVPDVNLAQIVQWKNTTANSFIASGTVAVDSFFAISGLLVVYWYMKNQEKNIPFSLPMFYIHRILRLTPSFIMIILFSATLLKHMGAGPFWIVVYEMFQRPCETNWWSSLIYLQNYIHTNDQCQGIAWYLAVDMQMYFISPLIFIPMAKWPKKTMIAIVTFVVLNCTYVFWITWYKDLGADFFDQDNAQYNDIYSPTHVRGTVYIMGMVCGYFVYQTRKKRPRLSTRVVVGLWTVSLGVLLGVVLGHSYFLQHKYTPLEGAFFNALFRVSWGSALCILILLCVNGYGSVIDAFLSHKIFTFLIRVNYNVYMLHLCIMVFITAQVRNPMYFSNMVAFHLFWGDYMFTLGAAVIWTLAFEAPVIAIERIIFGKKKPKQNTIIPK